MDQQPNPIRRDRPTMIVFVRGEWMYDSYSFLVKHSQVFYSRKLKNTSQRSLNDPPEEDDDIVMVGFLRKVMYIDYDIASNNMRNDHSSLSIIQVYNVDVIDHDAKDIKLLLLSGLNRNKMYSENRTLDINFNSPKFPTLQVLQIINK
ncbi:hypothetical protein MTR_8g062145 [Medicago truncatula]|uniref:Uncharacterized protein n=1 Tax=Medicago truncatula TaxID=3880 RepID=A0A072TSX0_MEDTR|nr:hypothetical protein MTR_8g062145 [Medicago truncatula]